MRAFREFKEFKEVGPDETRNGPPPIGQGDPRDPRDPKGPVVGPRNPPSSSKGKSDTSIVKRKQA